MFRNLMIAVMLLGLTVQANATPVLYDVTGKQTPDGMLYGTYIYDDVENKVYDTNIGIKCNTTNCFNWIDIEPEPGVLLKAKVQAIGTNLKVSNISNGYLPFVSDYVDINSDWLKSYTAIRFTSMYCDNCTFWAPEIPGWYPSLYNEEGYQQPVHNELIWVILPGAPVPVPEPSSLVQVNIAAILLIIGMMLVW